MPTQAYENAHSTPYWWYREDDHPYKCLIRHLKPYIEKVEKKSNDDLTKKFDNINKWVHNPHIDQKISNNFWTNPNIMDVQITQLLKFRYRQYMENARKHLFCSELFSNINCSLCRIIQPDTWLHLLLCCTKPHTHKLCINQYNKAIQEIRKFVISNTESRCYIVMNAGKTDAQTQENIVPHWLPPCTCNNQTQRCQCNAKLRLDILCIRNHPYNTKPPNQSNPTLTV